MDGGKEGRRRRRPFELVLEISKVSRYSSFCVVKDNFAFDKQLTLIGVTR